MFFNAAGIESYDSLYGYGDAGHPVNLSASSAQPMDLSQSASVSHDQLALSTSLSDSTKTHRPATSANTSLNLLPPLMARPVEGARPLEGVRPMEGSSNVAAVAPQVRSYVNGGTGSPILSHTPLIRFPVSQTINFSAAVTLPNHIVSSTGMSTHIAPAAPTLPSQLPSAAVSLPNQVMSAPAQKMILLMQSPQPGQMAAIPLNALNTDKPIGVVSHIQGHVPVRPKSSVSSPAIQAALSKPMALGPVVKGQVQVIALINPLELLHIAECNGFHNQSDL